MCIGIFFCCDSFFGIMHGLRTPREEKAFTAQPKIHSHSQIFRCGQSIFCLPHRPNFSDIFYSCLHWVSVVRVSNHSPSIEPRIVEILTSEMQNRAARNANGIAKIRHQKFKPQRWLHLEGSLFENCFLPQKRDICRY